MKQKNDKPMTHTEWIEKYKAKLSRPCSAHDIAPGGLCLNCGWEPEPTLVNENMFTCWLCQRSLPFIRKDSGMVTQNIGFISSGRGRHCYDCHTKLEIGKMNQEGKVSLYLTQTPSRLGYDYQIVNYAHTIEFACQRPKFSFHNLAGKRGRRDIDFVGPDGAKWHGVNIGDSQVIHCKRKKKQKKNMKPLKETTYIKPFNYASLSS